MSDGTVPIREVERLAIHFDSQAGLFEEGSEMNRAFNYAQDRVEEVIEEHEEETND